MMADDQQPTTGETAAIGDLGHQESAEMPGWCGRCCTRWPCDAEQARQEIARLTAEHANCSNLSHAEASRIFEEARQMRTLAEERGLALESIGRAVGMEGARAEKDLQEIVRTVVFMGERYGPICQSALQDASTVAELRAALERGAYVPSSTGLQCRYCHAIDHGVSPRGRDMYEVIHRDDCILARLGSERGAEIIAAGEAMALRLRRLREHYRNHDDHCQIEATADEAVDRWRALMPEDGR